MVDAVRQVVSGQFQSVTRGVINNVAGNIKGMIGMGRDNSPGAAINNKPKFYTQNLQYPMNVEGDPMQGHYILFMINQVSGRTSLRTKESKHMTSIKNKINYDISGDIRSRGGEFTGDDFSSPESFGDLFIDSGGKKINVKDTRGDSTPAARGNKHGSLVASKLSSSSLSTAIALYMPPSISSSYSMQYSDTEIGVGAAAIQQIATLLTQAFSGNFSQAFETGKNTGSTFETMGKRALLKGLDAVAPGVRAAAEINQGAILSNKMEMAFRGINRRKFEFTFIFMPKSEAEVEVVQNIIHMFKFHAHGEFRREAKNQDNIAIGYEMAIPDTFDIRYMYQGQQNTHLNKISTCYLESVNVSYGGDRYVAYKPTRSLHGDTSPPPQRTTLSLQFTEIEILDRSRIDEGF